MFPGDTRKGAGAGYPALKRLVYSLEGDKTYRHETSQYSPPEHKAKSHLGGFLKDPDKGTHVGGHSLAQIYQK